MWRAFFLSIGITSCLLGMECLFVDKAVLAAGESSAAMSFASQVAPSYREIEPPEWAPWSLMSAGAVTILYSFTIPRKMKS